MLDKLKLNNHITALRSDVQKAKVQIIQKLIRKLKEIEAKAKEDHLKGNSKIKKLNAEIKTLKKLKFRYLVQNALLLQKDPKTILSDGKSSTEERCFARIYGHKVLNKKIDMLKDVFELRTEENRKGLRNMGATKTQKAKLKKTTKINAEKNKKIDKWIEEEIDPENSVNDLKLETLTETVSTAAEIENNTNEKSKKKKNPESVLVAQNHNIKKISNVVKIKKVEFSSESENEESENVVSTDSFFITKTGSNYVTTVPKVTSETDYHSKRPYSDDEDYEVETRIHEQTRNDNSDYYKHYSRNDYKERRGQFQNNSNLGNERTKKSFREPSNDLHPSWKAKQQQRKIQPFLGKKVNFENSDAVHKFSETDNDTKDLHPSWVAKIKTKPVITHFAGKKIKFDDE